VRRFKVVVADPPWPFNDQLPGPGRGAAKHYSMMTLSDIVNYELPPIADDAVLFLWRVATMQPEAIAVCRAWGFVPRTELVWQKLTATGKPWFGMGRLLRGAHESVLVGYRVGGKPKRRAANVRSVFAAMVGEHSEKPEEFYALVERLLPGPYLELFARRERRGWTTIGDEL